MTTLRHDLRYACRSLLRTPGFTFAAVAALALGIGATTTIFTVVNGVLLRPLQYDAPERLANIWNDLGQGAQSLPGGVAARFPRLPAAQPHLRVLRRGSRGRRRRPAGKLDRARVSPNAPTSSRSPPISSPCSACDPMLGRQFRPEEEVVNGPHVIMLSHRLWQRRFAGDPGIVGKTIQIDGVAHEVVGVLPARLPAPAPRPRRSRSPTATCGRRSSSTTASRCPAT